MGEILEFKYLQSSNRLPLYAEVCLEQLYVYYTFDNNSH